MITYQPSFDPYHAVFRIVRLFSIIAKCHPVERDRIRLLDFFIAFPFLIETVKLKAEDRSFRAISKKYDYLIPFADLPEKLVLFQSMELPHRSAVDTLIRLNWLAEDRSGNRLSLSEGVKIPAPLNRRVEAINSEQSDLMSVIEAFCCRYDFFGASGLKSRTGLMEFRYDPV